MFPCLAAIRSATALTVLTKQQSESPDDGVDDDHKKITNCNLKMQVAESLVKGNFLEPQDAGTSSRFPTLGPPRDPEKSGGLPSLTSAGETTTWPSKRKKKKGYGIKSEAKDKRAPRLSMVSKCAVCHATT